LLLVFDEHTIWILSLSFFILTFADAFAALIGKKHGLKTYNLTGDTKSILGSAVFFVTTMVVMSFFVEFLYLLNLNVHTSFFEKIDFGFVTFLVIISTILTIIESVSSKGLDNLTVPLAAAFLISVITKNPESFLIESFSMAIILSFLITITSYRLKFLTLNGSVVTFLMATFIFGLGGIKWTLPILTFFILSSLISKFRKQRNKRVEEYFDKTGNRDYLQVLANGGVAWMLIILYQLFDNEVFYLLYITSIAAVCADTWSTEIGTLFRTKTYNILNFNPVEQGTNGGISIIGTIGGLLGSFIVTLTAFYWIQNHFIFVIVLIGLFGSLLDSFIGAKYQAVFQCGKCGLITERKTHCMAPTVKIRGFGLVNNDFVNISTGAIASLIFYLITIL